MKIISFLITSLMSAQAFATTTIVCDKNLDGVTHQLVLELDAISNFIEFKYTSSDGAEKKGNLGINCNPTAGFQTVSVTSGGLLGGSIIVKGSAVNVCRIDSYVEIQLELYTKFGDGFELSEFSSSYGISSPQPLASIDALKGASCTID